MAEAITIHVDAQYVEIARYWCRDCGEEFAMERSAFIERGTGNPYRALAPAVCPGCGSDDAEFLSAEWEDAP